MGRERRGRGGGGVKGEGMKKMKESGVEERKGEEKWERGCGKGESAAKFFIAKHSILHNVFKMGMTDERIMCEL